MFTIETLSLRSTCCKPTFVDFFFITERTNPKNYLNRTKKIHKLETYQCESWRGANIFEVLNRDSRNCLSLDAWERVMMELNGDDDGSRRRWRQISTEREERSPQGERRWISERETADLTERETVDPTEREDGGSERREKKDHDGGEGGDDRLK